MKRLLLSLVGMTLLAQTAPAGTKLLDCQNVDVKGGPAMPEGCDSDFKLWTISLSKTYIQGAEKHYIDYTYRELSSAPKAESRYVSRAAEIPGEAWWTTGPYSTGITNFIEVSDSQSPRYFAQAGAATLCADGKWRETRFQLRCTAVSPR